MTTGTGAFAVPGEGEQVPGARLMVKKTRKKLMQEAIDILDKIISKNKQDGRSC